MCPAERAPNNSSRGGTGRGFSVVPKKTGPERPLSLTCFYCSRGWFLSVATHMPTQPPARLVRAHSHSTASPPLRSDPAPVSPGEQGRADSARVLTPGRTRWRQPPASPSPPPAEPPPVPAGTLQGRGAAWPASPCQPSAPAGALGAPRLSDPELAPGPGPRARTRHTCTRLHVVEARGSLVLHGGHAPWLQVEAARKRKEGQGPDQVGQVPEMNPEGRSQARGAGVLCCPEEKQDAEGLSRRSTAHSWVSLGLAHPGTRPGTASRGWPVSKLQGRG